MIDRYSKIVLTVIAAALVAIAIEQAATKANAQGVECGSSSFEPCYVVSADGLSGVRVYVTNLP